MQFTSWNISNLESALTTNAYNKKVTSKTFIGVDYVQKVILHMGQKDMTLDKC